LRNDIGEKHNIAEELPDITTHLKRLLKSWRERVEANIPEPNPAFRNSERMKTQQ
jgi:hypothetical protein